MHRACAGANAAVEELLALTSDFNEEVRSSILSKTLFGKIFREAARARSVISPPHVHNCPTAVEPARGPHCAGSR